MNVPFSYLSFCPENPASGRWDQAHISRLLRGEEWLVPAGFRFQEEEYDHRSTRGRVVVFPAGHYSSCDYCTETSGREQLLAEVRRLDWAIVIATSDECSLFRWDLFDLPSHARLWVMQPRPEQSYPTGTFFFPGGSQHRLTHPPLGERDVDVFFSGQLGHERREQFAVAITDLIESRPDLDIVYNPTAGFAQGMTPEAYMGTMGHSKFVPCPSGPCTQDSFRFFEALEAGCFPLRDALRPGGEGEKYWEMVGLSGIGLKVPDWERHLSSVIGLAYGDWPDLAAHASSRWQQYKRRLAHRLDADVWSASFDMTLGHGVDPTGPDDEITVIIPTSPIPSHPDTAIIEETIASIRERLPTAEILITCDDVRPEQMERHDDYYEYVRRLTLLCNHQQNICPITHMTHQHQSGMMKSVLAEVHTPHVLYVEHDCPLVGDIDFDEIIEIMARDELPSMRFFHETEMQPGSEHLFGLEPGSRYARTVQWSQRPHLARTDWYRDIMATYFGVNSRTMIEDVMHGVVQSDLPTWKPDMKPDEAKQWDRAIDKTWRRWRMAVYAPDGSWKRSAHLDGRATDPKYPMTVAYDGERPPGAPPEGTLR